MKKQSGEAIIAIMVVLTTLSFGMLIYSATSTIEDAIKQDKQDESSSRVE